VQVGDLSTQGVVVWIGSRDDGQRYWTRSPDQVDVRAIAEAPSGAPPETSGTIVALIELPAMTGALSLQGTKLQSHWLARTALRLGGAAPMPWPTAPAVDLPDIGTPSEYWRWCIIAQRRGQQPPPPVGTIPERMWARHVASLWLAGLERVRQASEGIHAELVDALIGTAQDAQLPPPGDVAGWIARTEDLRALLTVLLESSANSEGLSQAALSWLRAHWSITTWVESDAGDRVRIAACNAGAGERVLKLTWVGVPDAVPVAMLLPPRTVVRQWIDRPALAASPDLVPIERLRGERLEAELGGQRKRIDVGAREYASRPPGLSFGAFLPPLALADAQAGTIIPMPPEWRTTASVRRRQSRWEVLVECMRPASDSNTSVPPEHADEVALFVGDPDSPSRTVRVTASGGFAVEGGSDDGASAGFMRWSDRWRARIELPDAWIPATSGGVRGGNSARPMVLSMERKPGAGLPRQTAALAVPQWSRTAPPVMIDLGAWTDPAPSK
jgi:hypothetical protein